MLQLSDLDQLSDRQLERVRDLAAKWRHEYGRISRVRARAMAEWKAQLPAKHDRANELAEVDAELSTKQRELELHGIGVLGRLGLGPFTTLDGRRFRLSAKPIIERIHWLRERRTSIASSAQAIADPVEPVLPAEPDPVIKVRVGGVTVGLDLRLKPTATIRAIEAVRRRARKGAKKGARSTDVGRSAAERSSSPSRKSVPRRSKGPSSEASRKPPVHRVTHDEWGESNFLRSKVYVLALECGKYYVGRCTNFPVRVRHHIEGRGARWTRLYRPVASHAFYWGAEPEEKAVTLHYMDIYGEENVRGWVFAKGGDYAPGSLSWHRMQCEPPLPLSTLEVCESLVPMTLPRSPLWEVNRRSREIQDIVDDAQPW